MALPRLGQVGEAEHGDVVSHLSGLAQESTFARSEWDSVVTDCLNIYTYGDVTPPGPNEIVVQEIQNSVIATTIIQTKDPAQVTLEPVETGEPPTYFWAGPAQYGLSLGLMPEQVQAFIDPETGEQRD